eukprot:m51a1_g11282 hypothetical protein (640) ;mRNA; r:19445-22582
MNARVRLTLGKFELFLEGRDLCVQTIVHAKEPELAYDKRFKSPSSTACEKKEGKFTGWLGETTEISDVPLSAVLRVQLWKKGTFYSTKLGTIGVPVTDCLLKETGETLMPVINSKSGTSIGNVAVTVEVILDAVTLKFLATELQSGAGVIDPSKMVQNARAAYHRASLDSDEASEKAKHAAPKAKGRESTGKKQKAPDKGAGLQSKLEELQRRVDEQPERKPAPQGAKSGAVLATAQQLARGPDGKTKVSEREMTKNAIEVLMKRLATTWEVKPRDFQQITVFLGTSIDRKLLFSEMQGVVVLLEVLGFYSYKAASPRAAAEDVLVIAENIAALEDLLTINVIAENLLKTMTTSIASLVRALPFVPLERTATIFNWMYMFYNMLDPNGPATFSHVSSTEGERKAFTVAVLNEMTLRVHGVIDDVLSEGDDLTKLSCLHFINSLIDSHNTAEARRAIREHFAHNGIILSKILDIIPADSQQELIEVAKRIRDSWLNDVPTADIDAELMELLKQVYTRAKATLCMEEFFCVIKTLATTMTFSTKIHEVASTLGVINGMVQRETSLDVATEETQTDWSGLDAAPISLQSNSENRPVDANGCCPSCGRPLPPNADGSAPEPNDAESEEKPPEKARTGPPSRAS